MMRVLYLALGTKKHPLYVKYVTILKELSLTTVKEANENTFNEPELARGGYIPWKIVLEKQRELEQNFNRITNKKSLDAYIVNQDLLLISLYCLIPPLRNEPKTLKFTDEAHTEGDWIYMKTDKTIILDLNEEKKKHNPIELKLPDHLQDIIRQSYTLYPRICAFTDTRPTKWKAALESDKSTSVTTMVNRLAALFKGFKNQDGIEYKVGASMLRSSYVNYMYYDYNGNPKHLRYSVKKSIAEQMRTSVEMIEGNYLKILNDEPMAAIVIPENTDKITQGVARPVIGQMRGTLLPVERTVQPVLIIQRAGGGKPIDQQNNTSSKKYYEKKKENILTKQKEYRKTPEHRLADAKRKVLKRLNSDPDYYHRISQTTVNKYNIQKVNGSYLSIPRNHSS
jgi:hypothetical protein